MTIDNFDPLDLPRFDENGAGRFAQNFIKEFNDSNLTVGQSRWIEDYFRNVSDKGLW